MMAETEAGTMSARTVWAVTGLPDETFDNEADAAMASILFMLEIPQTEWHKHYDLLRINGSAIQQRLGIILQPRNSARA